MTEYKTITMPKTMPLVERISGVSEEIMAWLNSLDEPFNISLDVMHLVKCELNDKYSYHYILDRAAKGPDKKKMRQNSGRKTSQGAE